VVYHAPVAVGGEGMNPIGLVGILVLLGLAWAMSFHRRLFPVRTVLWGLGLQLLFAVIVLKKDLWSFVGMAGLALLIVVFMLQRSGAGLTRVAGTVIAVGITAAVLAAYSPSALAPAMAVVLVFLLVNARLRLVTAAQAPAAAVLVALGVGWLVARGIHGQELFAAFARQVADFLLLSDYGARFLFGNLSDGRYFFTAAGAPWPGFGFQFAFKVLPTIIFVAGFMSILYYLGVMQRVIDAMARFMRWTMRTSGAETLCCTANIVLGQTEAPLLIRPYLAGLTASEVATVMVGGFATIAAGVMAGYIAMGIPAVHLIAASVMGAPAALVASKILFPEREHSQSAGDVGLPEVEVGANLVEAATNGISDGLKLAINVGGMLIGFIALLAVVDVLLGFVDGLVDGRLVGGAWVAYGSSGMSPAVGEFAGYFPGSLQTLFGTLLRPVAWLLGVPWAEAARVGNLIGIKTSLNEFVAYSTLSEYIRSGAISERSVIISTYALCGFANFSSIGIQIGGISALAPTRKADLARLGLRAMLAGAIASCLNAAIAGMLL
jgi:concentrative nucleoside transporter, CNT family